MKNNNILIEKKNCYINYTSEKSIDGLNSYNFWFSGNIIRIVSNKPFKKGDVISILEIVKKTNIEWNIYVEKIDSPITTLNIPILVFLTTKIYLDCESNYELVITNNYEKLLFISVNIDNNKSYTAVVLIPALKKSTIQAIDPLTDNKIEWTISNKRSL